MKRVAICIDAWKLPIFKKKLFEHAFDYDEHPGVTEDTLTLTVWTFDVELLAEVVQAANDEAAKSKLN